MAEGAEGPVVADSVQQRAFTAAARYRLRYPTASDAMVERALTMHLPALAYRPGLRRAAATTALPDPDSAAVLALFRLHSWLHGEHAPGVDDARKVAAVVVRLFEAATVGEAGGSRAYSSVLVSATRCGYWWGCTRTTAARHLKRLIDSGTLRVVSVQGRTRSVALGSGSPRRTEGAEKFLDPAHPVWHAIHVAYAEPAEQTRWFAAVHADDTSYEPRFDSEAMGRAEATMRERVTRSKALILQQHQQARIRLAVRELVRGLPRAGAPDRRLQAWMRVAVSRARASRIDDAYAPAIVSAVRERGHNEAVSSAVATKLVKAGRESAAAWGGSF